MTNKEIVEIALQKVRGEEKDFDALTVENAEIEFVVNLIKDISRGEKAKIILDKYQEE